MNILDCLIILFILLTVSVFINAVRSAIRFCRTKKESRLHVVYYSLGFSVFGALLSACMIMAKITKTG